MWVTSWISLRKNSLRNSRFPPCMDVIAEYRLLRKAGQLPDATQLLKREIGSLEPGAVAQAGKMLQKDLPAAFPDAKPWRVLVLGQCTTQYLLPVLKAWGWCE